MAGTTVLGWPLFNFSTPTFFNANTLSLYLLFKVHFPVFSANREVAVPEMRVDEPFLFKI
jgi:hypothetical protein